MTALVAVDIGGTHARFAIAETVGGKVVSLKDEVTLRTAEHASFQTAWEAYGRLRGQTLPRAAAISIACPIEGALLKLTNNPWIIRPALIPQKLGVERFTLVNDFAAVARAVGHVGSAHLSHLSGPDVPLPETGLISIVGPGTGLGVSGLLRLATGDHVLQSEGGHIDFAPLDGLEDAILKWLRERYRRVSVERMVSGPGLANIYEALASIEGRSINASDDTTLWTAALEGADSLAAAALDRFCLILGAVAGDIALTHRAAGVVIAGGLGLRLANYLPQSGFAQRFAAKGRFEALMARIPVKLITHPQPGLLGAAASFALEHTS